MAHCAGLKQQYINVGECHSVLEDCAHTLTGCLIIFIFLLMQDQQTNVYRNEMYQVHAALVEL